MPRLKKDQLSEESLSASDLPYEKTNKPKTENRKLSAPVYSLAGEMTGQMELPEEIFGVRANKALILQALRVYQTNRSVHHSHTKTRGEVSGSTVKIWRQKGTGRARHGARTAPIFVGGGIAFGPKSRKTVLDLPKKMKHAALKSAFSLKASDKELFAVEGLEKASGKTSEFASLLAKFQKKSVMFVSGDRYGMAERAVRNLPGVSFMFADGLNVYDVIRHKSLVLTQDAVGKLQERFGNKQEPPVTKKGTRKRAKI